MRAKLAPFIMLFAGACAITDSRTCVDPLARAAAIVKLDDAQGTAFLTKPNEMVTVQHVTEQLGMSSAWQLVNLSQRLHGPHDSWTARTALMRIKRIYSKELPEELHVLEMRGPYALGEVPTLTLREKPLMTGEKVTAGGYANGQRTFASGYYVGDSALLGTLYGFVGFNLTDSQGRYPLTRGVSGGPIFDCEGAVVGAVARAYTGSPKYPGYPNVHGIPISTFARAYRE